jgi:hypothetical protein
LLLLCPFFTGEVFGTNRLIYLLLHPLGNVERKFFGSNFINAQTFDTRQPSYRYSKSSFFNLRKWFESIF